MIGVIADDLTGAAELGGVGLRRGLNAEVIIHGECKSGADLVCFDTDSRSCSTKEAVRRAAAAADKLRKAGAQWIYKKVDSVLRGNVVAEVRAIQKALGLRAVLLAPANPGLGRVIRDGRYYVKGKLIHQTDFARDPEFPRTSSNVLEMLGPSAKRGVTVCQLDESVAASGISLGEVSSSADVGKWASRREPDTLLAGGAEFFGALLDAREPISEAGMASRSAAEKESLGSVRELFVCGSTSDSTRDFVNQAERSGTPVFSVLHAGGKRFQFGSVALENFAEQAVDTFRSHARLVLTIGLPLIEKRSVAQRLARHLAEVAVLVITRARPQHVYAEGGATAAELVRQLGWRQMKVLKELAPGVTTLSLLNRQLPLLTLKPGSYAGWPRRP